MQERFKSHMEFRSYNNIGNKTKNKFCEVYDTASLVKEISVLKVYIKC